MKVNITISLKHLVLGFLFLALSYFTAIGKVQQHIHFAGLKNEFAFFMLAAILGFGLIVTSFSKK
jgi:hypothetical protein